MKQYYVRTLSTNNGVTCIYIPRELKDIGFEAGKHIKLSVDEKEQLLIISKIKDGMDMQI